MQSFEIIIFFYLKKITANIKYFANTVANIAHDINYRL